MNYTISICDDEDSQAEYTRALVEQWAKSRDYLVEITAFPSAESFLFHYEENKNTDILLLDIEMNQMNGVDLAKEIRRENKEVQIVFITGYMEYIAAGYDVEALHYLLKPVMAEKLFPVLDRAAQRLQRRESCLLITQGDQVARVPLHEIRSMEVRQNYVTIHAGEDYTVKRTLSDIEKDLDESFFRTGRSFIVNLRYVRKITKTEVLLKEGGAVPLSRGLYHSINQAVIRYF